MQITRPTERRGRLSSREMAQRLPGRFDVTIPGAPADVHNNTNSTVYHHRLLQEELEDALDGLLYEVYKLLQSRSLAIYNHFLLSGAPPSDWSNAGLVPLFKKENR